MISLSPTGSALLRTDLSPLTNGIWEIHAGCSCFLHLQLLAKIGYIPQFKASNAIDQNEVSLISRECCDIVKCGKFRVVSACFFYRSPLGKVLSGHSCVRFNSMVPNTTTDMNKVEAVQIRISRYTPVSLLCLSVCLLREIRRLFIRHTR